MFSRRLLTGTISDLSPSIRIAWIAILFEAEKLRGRVKLPVRDLAKLASITTPEAAEALRVFQEPDPYSSSTEAEGRRLLPVDGEQDWYIITTWEKHTQERAVFFNRLRQQRHRARKGVTTEDAIRKQGRCSCCGAIFHEPYSLYVTQDHDHATGMARGLICQSCNKIVGMIERGQASTGDHSAHEAYIERWSRVTLSNGSHDNVTIEPEPEPELGSPPSSEKEREARGKVEDYELQREDEEWGRQNGVDSAARLVVWRVTCRENGYREGRGDPKRRRAYITDPAASFARYLRRTPVSERGRPTTGKAPARAVGEKAL